VCIRLFERGVTSSYRPEFYCIWAVIWSVSRIYICKRSGYIYEATV